MASPAHLSDPRGWHRLPVHRVGQNGLISIVIPCYRQARFLPEAIESALQQTYPDIEVIVVDDGSPDNTAQVAQSYPSIRYFRQSHRGVSAARNTGLVLSKGDYLIFLDADDRLLPASVQMGMDILACNHELAFVFGPVQVIDSSGSRYDQRIPSIDQTPYAHLLQRNFIYSPGSVLFKRWVFSVVGGFDPSVDAVADYDFYLRVARSLSIAWHHEPVLEYRKHDSNMSRDLALMLKTVSDVLGKQLEHVKGHKQLEEAYRSGRNFYKHLYGEQLVGEIAKNLKSDGELFKILQDVLMLLRHYPESIILHARRTMKRLIRTGQRGGIIT